MKIINEVQVASSKAGNYKIQLDECNQNGIRQYKVQVRKQVVTV